MRALTLGQVESTLGTLGGVFVVEFLICFDLIKGSPPPPDFIQIGKYTRVPGFSPFGPSHCCALLTQVTPVFPAKKKEPFSLRLLMGTKAKRRIFQMLMQEDSVIAVLLRVNISERL